jgi:hypothetical protein
MGKHRGLHVMHMKHNWIDVYKLQQLCSYSGKWWLKALTWSLDTTRTAKNNCGSYQ